MKKRILFVDDERKVLEGLRRMLHSLRRELDMEFAEGGRQALDRFGETPFDVLVTDMRMPGMNGAELLDEVMKRYPETVRIILSGQCDRETVLKCVGPAHQFLTKPCSPDMLMTTVVRACGVSEYGVDSENKRVLSRLSSLPSLPSRHEALVAEIDSSDPSMERVAEIIASDVGMGAKTLQLVSSSFFGTPRRVSDVALAVHLLGVDTLRPLVRSGTVFFPLECDAGLCMKCEAVFEHSARVAQAARAISRAETEDESVASDAFLAGFLHEVGRIALAPPCLGSGAVRHSAPAGQTEEELFSQAGAYLMALWGLREPIVEAIAHRGSPGDSPDRAFTALTAVHAADALLAEGGVREVDVDYLERIGRRGRLETWQEICEGFQLQKVL